MSEYIERDAVLEMLKQECSTMVFAYLAVLVNDIPAADVRPVVKAHWIPTGETAEVYGDVYRCSACGCCDIDAMDFCPNCGAMMEEADV